MNPEKFILSLFLFGVLTSVAESMAIKRNKKDSWQRITQLCRVDFENQVRFFADDVFRVCNEDSCPLDGEPGPFGVECRKCCEYKVNVTSTDAKSSEQSASSMSSWQQIGGYTNLIFGTVIGVMAILIIIMALHIRNLKKKSRHYRTDDSNQSATSSTSSSSSSPKGKLRTDLSPGLTKSLITKDSIDTLTGKTFEHTVTRLNTLERKNIHKQQKHEQQQQHQPRPQPQKKQKQRQNKCRQTASADYCDIIDSHK